MPKALPPRSTPPRPDRAPVRLRRRLLTLTGLGLAGLVAGLLSGCSGALTSTSRTLFDAGAPSFAQLAGNWRFSTGSSTGADANHLNTLAGSLSIQGATVSGTLHPLLAGQCLGAAEVIRVTGAVSADSSLTLLGQTSSGTTVSIAGTVAADRHSLDAPTLTATGGACLATTASLTAPTTAPRIGAGPTAQQYQPVTGTYAGNLTTDDGQTFPLATTVTQLDQPDSTGSYHIQGTAASPGNACLPGSITATASNLSGGDLTATYTDPSGTTTIAATGSASPDGATITLTNWQLTSACGSDSGTATLTRQ